MAAQGRQAPTISDRSSDPWLRPSPVRSEEHTSELQSHSDLPSFPTRRSSDLRTSRLVSMRVRIGWVTVCDSMATPEASISRAWSHVIAAYSAGGDGGTGTPSAYDI